MSLVLEHFTTRSAFQILEGRSCFQPLQGPFLSPFQGFDPANRNYFYNTVIPSGLEPCLEKRYWLTRYF
jgi:hypothetical protein